jgi:hypothetical protein
MNFNSKYGQILTLLQYIKVFISDFFSVKTQLSRGNEKIMSDLKYYGYSVIPNYLSRETAIELGVSVESVISNRKTDINMGDDLRIFGIEHFLQPLLDFKQDKQFQELSNFVNRRDVDCRYVMANLLIAGNDGSSGQGWHRDAFGTQFKAIIYLSDVSIENGPLEIIPQSHKLRFVTTLVGKGILKFKQNRMTNHEAKAVMNCTESSKKLVGDAGTVIVFNSTTIHRGHPIIDGKRIAATNYYLPDNFKDEIHVVSDTNA